jgi:hypothetical protein
VGKAQALWGPDGVVYEVEGIYADHLTVKVPGSDELEEVNITDLAKFTPALMPKGGTPQEPDQAPAKRLTPKEKAEARKAAKAVKGKGQEGSADAPGDTPKA